MLPGNPEKVDDSSSLGGECKSIGEVSEDEEDEAKVAEDEIAVEEGSMEGIDEGMEVWLLLLTLEDGCLKYKKSIPMILRNDPIRNQKI